MSFLRSHSSGRGSGRFNKFDRWRWWIKDTLTRLDSFDNALGFHDLIGSYRFATAFARLYILKCITPI